MERLITRTGGIRLRRIDIDTWDSPVARQYGIRSLPTLWLYVDGERTASDPRAVLAKLAAR
ncbi:MAG: thioredoxin family protein [Planctomycetes bacterium]|nr:thioredoxin family protein [Planctomycetota bacterium]